jgi:hypothetical protein
MEGGTDYDSQGFFSSPWTLQWLAGMCVFLFERSSRPVHRPFAAFRLEKQLETLKNSPTMTAKPPLRRRLTRRRGAGKERDGSPSAFFLFLQSPTGQKAQLY